MNKEESKTIPLRKATHKELMEVITDLHTQNYLKEMEIVRLHSIIKEVREYIKGNKDKTMPIWGSEDYDFETCLFEEDIKEILEILDKENK